jgi:Na+-transporting methylmalonyl-CoA/oxaloacetate decarboxylase gamma subunit
MLLDRLLTEVPSELLWILGVALAVLLAIALYLIIKLAVKLVRELVIRPAKEKKEAEKAAAEKKGRATERLLYGPKLVEALQKIANEANKAAGKEKYAVTSIPENGSSFSVFIVEPNKNCFTYGAPGILGYCITQTSVIHSDSGELNVHCFLGPYGPEETFSGSWDYMLGRAVKMVGYKLSNRAA